jgi:tartrate/fumarate subfamily iron-sulfur-dependent hydro-lyase alpha chain
MIRIAQLENAMYGAMRRAATLVPPDVEAALRQALKEETDPLARQHLDVSFENFRLAAEGLGLVCADTGFPLYYVRVGRNVRIEGGLESLQPAAERATARATADGFLRPTMVDPLTRKNPGNNCLDGMPKVELILTGEGDELNLIAAPKGGGSEIFGTFYRMLFPSDGEAGIVKFVLEAIRDGCYAGKICPPAIVGVGIGGTADLCMKRAKEAALLRPVGRPNPRPDLAALEARLLAATRDLGLGAMGARGHWTVMALHIATAATHTAALPVAVNAQCLVGRRWRARLDAGGQTTFTGELP